jgi:hypothetical protein
MLLFYAHCNRSIKVEEVATNIDARDTNGLSALWVAVNRGDEHTINLLTNSGAAFGAMPPVNTRQFEPPAHRPPVATVSSGQREAKTSDKSPGRNMPPAYDEGTVQTDGEATVAHAATEGNLDVLLSLVAAGENMDSPDAFGKAPLRLVCISALWEVCCLQNMGQFMHFLNAFP